MLLITIWPIFALICLGFVLARSSFPSAEFWPAAERINYFLLFPALLVSSLARAPLQDPTVLRLGAAAVATILAAALALALFRRLRPMPAARFGPVLQGVVRFNTYLVLSIVAILAGTEGLERAAVILAVAVPLVNVLSIFALTEGAGGGTPRVLLRAILRNPLILACVAGFALALSGIGLPLGTGDFLRLLGQGSLPLGLLCVGAALKPMSLHRDMAALTGACLVRLLAMPLLAALAGAGFGLSGVEALVLVVFSAVPTAPTAYVLTRQLNGDGNFMAGIVTSQTLASVLTIPLVLMLLDPR
ncbi:AEC family transporter [Salipiger sp.]|uniref:AEC family transporter n=1 Tax=Salipiger sp. TaxID=2078585 RepID=UPI003A985DC2